VYLGEDDRAYCERRSSILPVIMHRMKMNQFATDLMKTGECGEAILYRPKLNNELPYVRFVDQNDPKEQFRSGSLSAFQV